MSQWHIYDSYIDATVLYHTKWEYIIIRQIFILPGINAGKYNYTCSFESGMYHSLDFFQAFKKVFIQEFNHMLPNQDIGFPKCTVTHLLLPSSFSIR